MIKDFRIISEYEFVLNDLIIHNWKNKITHTMMWKECVKRGINHQASLFKKTVGLCDDRFSRLEPELSDELDIPYEGLSEEIAEIHANSCFQSGVRRQFQQSLKEVLGL